MLHGNAAAVNTSESNQHTQDPSQFSSAPPLQHWWAPVCHQFSDCPSTQTTWSTRFWYWQQWSNLMLGSSRNFYLRKFPAFPELQATASAFSLSCSLQHTAVCGFWYFPLMISVCYRLLGSALWLVGGMGQMLPGLSVNCVQWQETGFDHPRGPSQSAAPTNPVGFGSDTPPTSLLFYSSTDEKGQSFHQGPCPSPSTLLCSMLPIVSQRRPTC